MSKVISMIEECLQEKARVRRTPPHPADMDATLADIERAKCLLDWEPRVSLEEGIRRTADWYIENRSWRGTSGSLPEEQLGVLKLLPHLRTV